MEEKESKQLTFSFNKIEISSDFESGNLCRAVQKDPQTFHLWISADPGTTFRTWFYFSVAGVPANTILTFCMINTSNQVKLMKEGHLPVFKSEAEPVWNRIKIPLQQNGVVKTEYGFQVTFKHQFTNYSKHYFAFSYPWTLRNNDEFIQQLVDNHKHRGLTTYYKELTLSTQGRSVNLLTICRRNKQSHDISNEFVRSEQKKGIFISARVHPGEVASSYVLNGFLKLLFSDSKIADQLLMHFVFYIVPIINPDGVVNGNFRTDSLGRNLNRFYTDPSPKYQPEICAIKNFILKGINNKLIHFCLDLHAHVNKQGVFVYGNSSPNIKDQVDICLFPKIMEYNSAYFDYYSCNFSYKNMSSKDRIDEMSKEGASRVTIFKETGLPSCWTLECNYNSTRVINLLPKVSEYYVHKSISNGTLNDRIAPYKKYEVTYLNIGYFEAIGRSIGESILDYYQLRKYARIFSSKLKNWSNIRMNLAICILRMIPFRFDNQCRKLLNGLNSNTDSSEVYGKIRRMIEDDRIYKSSYIKENDGRFKKSNKNEPIFSSIRSIKMKYAENNSCNDRSYLKMRSIDPKVVSLKVIDEKRNRKPTSVAKNVTPLLKK